MVSFNRSSELLQAVEEMKAEEVEHMKQSAMRKASASFDEATATAAAEDTINASFQELKQRIIQAYPDSSEQAFALMLLDGEKTRSYGSLKRALIPILLEPVNGAHSNSQRSYA